MAAESAIRLQAPQPAEGGGSRDRLDHLRGSEPAAEQERERRRRSRVVLAAAEGKAGHHGLVVFQHDGAVLQQSTAAPKLGAADDLASGHHHLTSGGPGKTGAGVECRWAGRGRGRSCRTQLFERSSQHPVDLQIGGLQASPSR